MGSLVLFQKRITGPRRVPRPTIGSPQRFSSVRRRRQSTPGTGPDRGGAGRWRHWAFRAAQPGNSFRFRSVGQIESRPGRDQVARQNRQNPRAHSPAGTGLVYHSIGSAGSGRFAGATVMKAFNTTLLFYPKNNPKMRLFALWYFTTLMIVWNVLGHTKLGFEQSWATPVVAVLTAILVSIFLDWVDARAKGRDVRFAGSVG